MHNIIFFYDKLFKMITHCGSLHLALSNVKKVLSKKLQITTQIIFKICYFEFLCVAG